MRRYLLVLLSVASFGISLLVFSGVAAEVVFPVSKSDLSEFISCVESDVFVLINIIAILFAVIALALLVRSREFVRRNC